VDILDLGGRPAQYYAKKYDELDAKSTVIEYQRPDEGWFDWAENAKQTIQRLLDIEEPNKTKRKNIAKALYALGILLISLSKDINKGLDRPDWRTILDQAQRPRN
jgi:hypothetical protein